jgi:acyl phosphate:glycerol-3-phosphate acyltransferase
MSALRAFGWERCPGPGFFAFFLFTPFAGRGTTAAVHQNTIVHMPWIEQLQSANWFQATTCTLGAYLLGCIATGYYLVRARLGRDIREIESGSTGARNVGRVLGKSGFGLTVLADLGKGALAVWTAFEWTHNRHFAALAMLAVVAGHIWPAQLRFRGGKGAATSLGALLMFDYRLALVFAVLFLAGYGLARKSVLPGMFAFACLPLAGFWLERDRVTAALTTVLVAAIFYAHRRNFADEINLLTSRRGVAPKPESTEL